MARSSPLILVKKRLQVERANGNSETPGTPVPRTKPLGLSMIILAMVLLCAALRRSMIATSWDKGHGLGYVAAPCPSTVLTRHPTPISNLATSTTGQPANRCVSAHEDRPAACSQCRWLWSSQESQATIVVIECGGGLAIPSVRVQGEACC